MLRTLPELLGAIEQADRAALYQAWVSTSPTDVWEPLSKCDCGPRSGAVDLERVGVRGPEDNSLVPALRSVDLERVGGGLETPTPLRALAPQASLLGLWRTSTNSHGI